MFVVGEIWKIRLCKTVILHRTSRKLRRVHKQDPREASPLCIIIHLLYLSTTFQSLLGNPALKVNCLYTSITSRLQGNYRCPYFHNAGKIISETLCEK